jgi:hypothetical protein
VQNWARPLARRAAVFTGRKGAATCQTRAFSKARRKMQQLSLRVVAVIGGKCVLSNCCEMNTYMRGLSRPEDGPLTSTPQGSLMRGYELQGPV